MPQALVPVLNAVGVGGVVGQVLSVAAGFGGLYFVSSLLRPGPSKPAASEREVKSANAPRVHVLGERRVSP